LKMGKKGSKDRLYLNLVPTVGEHDHPNWGGGEKNKKKGSEVQKANLGDDRRRGVGMKPKSEKGISC